MFKHSQVLLGQLIGFEITIRINFPEIEEIDAQIVGAHFTNSKITIMHIFASILHLRLIPKTQHIYETFRILCGNWDDTMLLQKFTRNLRK